ncbi:hypothetical protein D3C85_1576410 [compost metagenome]
MAQRRGLAEVAGLVQGEEKLELFDIHGTAWQVSGGGWENGKAKGQARPMSISDRVIEALDQ